MQKDNQKTKTIVTLGPATRTEEDLRKIKNRGVDFVRINMSHSSIEDFRYFIALAKKVGIPFIVDTEGSQVRTGSLEEDKVTFAENAEVKLYNHPIIGNSEKINLKPEGVVRQLETGDILHVDFDSLILRVSNTSTLDRGYITAKVISAGILGNNKAVAIDPGMDKKFTLPALSAKDYESIQVGLEEGVGHVAASFMRSKTFVEEVRQASQGKMKIISKIECVDALENFDEIIEASDFLLLDRGDLSKEIPIEKIPLTQKMIISKSNQKGKGVFVATNFLETMIKSKKPTRAEVNDVINTVLDGAYGLALSAETAIGDYPIACVNMLNKLIEQADIAKASHTPIQPDNPLIASVAKEDYASYTDSLSGLVAPHGGKLVNRVMTTPTDDGYLFSLPKAELNQNLQMDVEQIAMGTFSPIEGFMGSADLAGVLDNMRLESGDVWTIPIILDVEKDFADTLKIGKDVALWDENGPMALLHLEEKYELDKADTNKKLYDTESLEHPGVRWINAMKPVLLGGKINLLRRKPSEYKEYELTPRQVRRTFSERGWSKVVGFHTRNVIHRSHEFIQLEAMKQGNCDGLFVHPVIGKKKPGDFHAKYIINAYEHMVQSFYPRDKVVFATYATFSRYAGPREAIFTALCRKNYGCSHFVVGRDHTGVGDFYHPKASHEIFDKFDDLGITPIRFGKVFYSKKTKQHVHETDDSEHSDEEKMHISGTQAREMFEKGEQPPEWFMRPEISSMILAAADRGEEVFVPNEASNNQGKVLWFTGLSGSGKTTIAKELKKLLQTQGKSVAMLDGDDVRDNREIRLGFSREDIRENNKLIARMAKEKSKEHDFVIAPIISPYQEDRDMVRSIIGNGFYSVFINASLDACIARDTKGFYARALRGEIDDFIGVSPNSPYEAPQSPDLMVNTADSDVVDSTQSIINFLKSKNLI
jgi:pyruvate kinase